MPEGGTEDHGTEDHGTEDHGTEGHGTDGHGMGETGPADLSGPTAGAGAERRRLEEDFLLAMRRAGSIMQLLGQVSADRIGINATDLNCLNIVALTGHMTAGELARQTGLSTASITGVLDRLEEDGFVRRVRDPHDRRRVIVELGGGPGLREVGATFAPLVKAWRATAATYSDDELRLLLEFQARVQEIIRGQLARLRGDDPTPPPAP
jgi:DNA-binding MarR family transcriptional regulator